MKDLKVLNLEKYVGCRVSSPEVSKALVVGYNAKMNCLIVDEDENGRGRTALFEGENGCGRTALFEGDKIMLDTTGRKLWYLSTRLVREVHEKETLRDMVGLDVMYQGKPSRCVGYNESLNACILRRYGGWARFSIGDVIGVSVYPDAGFEYADYNEVEVLRK